MLDIGNTMAEIKMLERQASGPIEEQTSRIVEMDPVMIMLNQQSALLECRIGKRTYKIWRESQACSTDSGKTQ